jgi:glycosyltransferase involved in cell wall biosynthesis
MSEHIQEAAAPPQLVHGDNAWLVPPESPAALAEAVQRLAQDENLRMRLGAGAQQLATHFGWEEIAQRHQEVYRAHSFQNKPPMTTDEHR